MADNSDLFQSVKNYLFSRAHSPGKKLATEAELAARFKVSRYKIRQVMTTLAQMGFIDRSPRRGSVVRPPDTAGVSGRIQMQMEVAGFDPGEFTEARLLVECCVIPLVIKRATPKMLGQLDAVLHNMAACGDDFHKADQFDKEFHLLLLEACGNRVMQVFSGMLVSHFDNTQYQQRFRDSQYVLETIVQEHREVLDAIRGGNVKLAVEKMEKHLLEMNPLATSPRTPRNKPRTYQKPSMLFRRRGRTISGR